MSTAQSENLQKALNAIGRINPSNGAAQENIAAIKFALQSLYAEQLARPAASQANDTFAR